MPATHLAPLVVLLAATVILLINAGMYAATVLYSMKAGGGAFDVDGQTATTLLVATLEELGAAVTYHIPIREIEGHGVNLPALKQVIEEQKS